MLCLDLSSRWTYLKNLPRLTFEKLQNLNLYQTEQTDIINIDQQRIYTRVYLCLYIILLGIILFYTAFIERRVSKTHYSPLIHEYEELFNYYSDDINCPCTYVSIPHKEFIIQFAVTSFHHACDTSRLDTMLTTGK